MTLQEMCAKLIGMDIDDFIVTTFDPETGQSEPVTSFYIDPENKTIDLDTDSKR